METVSAIVLLPVKLQVSDPEQLAVNDCAVGVDVNPGLIVPVQVIVPPVADVAAAVPTLILLTLAAFALNTWARGDPAEAALRQGGVEPTREAIAEYREKMGLNDPLAVRYLHWMNGLAHGDLGRSFLDQRPVSDKMMTASTMPMITEPMATIRGSSIGPANLLSTPRAAKLDGR